MPEPTNRAQVWIEGSTLATYRYISERTHIPLSKLVTDTLAKCAGFYMTGANAALDGVMRGKTEIPEGSEIKQP